MSGAERDKSIVAHIKSYCEQIQETIDRFGDDSKLFAQDKIYQNAVSLCILQIGELVGILSDEFKISNPQIPWREIRKMRNIVAHKYGSFDSSITWDVIKSDIPNLLSFCNSIK